MQFSRVRFTPSHRRARSLLGSFGGRRGAGASHVEAQRVAKLLELLRGCGDRPARIRGVAVAVGSGPSSRGGPRSFLRQFSEGGCGPIDGRSVRCLARLASESETSTLAFARRVAFICDGSNRPCRGRHRVPKARSVPLEALDLAGSEVRAPVRVSASRSGGAGAGRTRITDKLTFLGHACQSKRSASRGSARSGAERSTNAVIAV